MNDFSRGDSGTTSYEDFMQSLMPAFAGVGGSGGVTGVAISGFSKSAMTFAAGDPVGGTLQALQTAISLIGRGRKEADEITAVQTPVSGLLEQVNTEMGVPSISIERLTQLRAFVTGAGAQMQEVIARPWSDGRAAEQAKATMFTTPGYLRVTIENIDKMLAARGAGPNAATPADPGASGGTVVAIAAAGLAWLFFG